MASSDHLKSVSTQAPDASRWSELYEKRRKELERASLRLGVLDTTEVSSRETFQTFMNDITTKYANKNVSKLVQKVSGPLSHVNSFSGALSSFSQLDASGMIVGASLKVVIEVRPFACIPRSTL